MPPQSNEFGPTPNAGVGGTVLPAPAQPPAPGAMQDVMDVMAIVNAAKSLGANHPSAVPLIQQLNDLVQQIQMSIVQSSPPSQVAAPPV